MSSSLSIHRDRHGSIDYVGTIDQESMTFSYDESYLQSAKAIPLSFSLPLRPQPYNEAEFRPYFEGLLPEGNARKELAGELRVRESDYLSILASTGLDCIGDVIVNLDAYRAEQAYEPLSLQEVKEILVRPLSIAEASIASRLSLAGTQGKAGLYHDERFTLQEGWHLPKGGAASTHVLKTESLNNLSIIEYLCMKCAEKCGINVAETNLLNFTAPVICSTRYDRKVESTSRGIVIERLHQEDLTQAFGLLPGSKYAELKPSTVASVAAFLRANTAQPLLAVRDFARIACFNYLIGNCDNHLKNLSVLQNGNERFATLAPAYDLICTTVFDRFSRVMGMQIGKASDIDSVTPENFFQLAHDLEISPASLQRLCQKLIAEASSALGNAATNIANDFPIAPSLADDIQEDIAPRVRILEAFCTR